MIWAWDTGGLVGQIAQLSRQFDEAIFEIVGAAHGVDRLFAAPALPAPGQDDRHDEQHNGNGGAARAISPAETVVIADAEDDAIPLHGETLA